MKYSQVKQQFPARGNAYSVIAFNRRSNDVG